MVDLPAPLGPSTLTNKPVLARKGTELHRSPPLVRRAVLPATAWASVACQMHEQAGRNQRVVGRPVRGEAIRQPSAREKP